MLFPTLHPHWPKKGLQGHKAHTSRKPVSVARANVANRVPCNHVSVCVSTKGLCFTPSFFVFKWTLNDFDVSVETLAIRESTLASIPCQGLTLNWRAAVNKLVHTHTRDGLLQIVWGLFVVPLTQCSVSRNDEGETLQ